MDSLVILGLLLINGFFAMAELAILSARRVRLQTLATKGYRAAARALSLMDKPSQFLPTVQIGITVVGIFAGAYSGATIAEPLGLYLNTYDWIMPYGDNLAIAVVVVLITYISLVIGELVPKQIALKHAEAIAMFIAMPMIILARLTAPMVWLLSTSTSVVLCLFGGKTSRTHIVTEEEVKALVAEATQAGVVANAEKDMIGRVLHLADRPVRMIMTPRRDVIWLDINDSTQDNLAKIRRCRHVRFPVSDGEIDKVIGVVQAKDLLDQHSAGIQLDIRRALQPPLMIPETTSILQALDQIRQSPADVAVVVDEYGTLEGIVTTSDLLQAIVGTMPDAMDSDEPTINKRDDGSWLIDGKMLIEDVEQNLQLSTLPRLGHYQTLAGLFLAHLGRLPHEGDQIILSGVAFEVIDMDGRRVDKVLARRLIKPNEEDSAA